MGVSRSVGIFATLNGHECGVRSGEVLRGRPQTMRKEMFLNKPHFCTRVLADKSHLSDSQECESWIESECRLYLENPIRLAAELPWHQ